MITIREFNTDEWNLFRNIRLESLQDSSGVFLDNYDNASKQDKSHWINMIADQSCAIFGLFDKETIIGLTSIFTWQGDKSGKTAILAMSFIKAAYRGQGLSHKLYEARIEWARKTGHFDKIRVSHREGNEASRRANQAFGFDHVATEMISWPDGTKANEYIYELRL